MSQRVTCVLKGIVTACLKEVGQDLQGQELWSPHRGQLKGSRVSRFALWSDWVASMWSNMQHSGV